MGKFLMGAAGAAGVAALVCFLLKGGESSTVLTKKGDDKKVATKVSVEEITKDMVVQILQEVIDSQEKMKGYMRSLTQELVKDTLSFEQTYEKVRAVQPDDPLDKYGLSMMDFDQVLDKHQADDRVRELIAKIMGVPQASSATSMEITADTIIEVHTFMLNELEAIAKSFQGSRNAASYDTKTVTIAAQAMVGAKIEKKFRLTSEDIEGAVLNLHTTLATNQEFHNVNIKIQWAMSKLMGQNFGPPR